MPTVTVAVPWDLTLTIGGQAYATCKPTLAQLKELAGVEAVTASAVGRDADLEGRLRTGLASFLPPACAAVLDGEPYDELAALLAAASAYFEGWLQRKCQAARAAGRQAAGVPETAAPTAAPAIPLGTLNRGPTGRPGSS